MFHVKGFQWKRINLYILSEDLSDYLFISLIKVHWYLLIYFFMVQRRNIAIFYVCNSPSNIFQIVIALSFSFHSSFYILQSLEVALVLETDVW